LSMQGPLRPGKIGKSDGTNCPPPFFPPPNNNFSHPQMLNLEEKTEPEQGRCYQRLMRFAQQPEPAVLLPLWCFRPGSQAGCALLAAALFLAMGAGLLSSSGSAVEIGPIAYVGSDAHKEFTVDKEIDGNALVYYELPGMLANRKYIVENKDPDLINTMMGRVKCIDAESQAALWRRSCDVSNRAAQGSPLVCSQDGTFAALINGVGSTDTFKPCGLLALSMFMDHYRLEKHVNGNWTQVSVSEENLALPHETGTNSKVYGSKIDHDNGALTINGAQSWLTPGPVLEHFKVWYRPPASPLVKNLWGRIEGPLRTGKYRVLFTSNSPIYTEQWGLEEKRVIIAGEHSLGSKGACKVLGGVALTLGLVELLTAAGFFVAKLTVGKSM